MEGVRAAGERRNKKTKKKNNNQIQADASVPLRARSCVYQYKACRRSSAGKGNLGVHGGSRQMAKFHVKSLKSHANVHLFTTIKQAAQQRQCQASGFCHLASDAVAVCFLKRFLFLVYQCGITLKKNPLRKKKKLLFHFLFKFSFFHEECYLSLFQPQDILIQMNRNHKSLPH